LGSFVVTGSTKTSFEIEVELKKLWQEITLPEHAYPASFSPRKKVIVLSGPTGVGKTALSLAIAQTVRGEVISADSMQVYRGMDIGTAKATPAEQQAVTHHLIDIRDIQQSCNVMEFYQAALESIDTIHARGHIPIVVGGTGFYLHSLIYGPPSGPPSVESVRAGWEKELLEKGTFALFGTLKDLDPEYADTITQNDKHKIVRALEIISLTNKKVSELPRGDLGGQKYDFRCWFLYMPKDILYRRIEQRCDEMIEKGFVEEVKRLEQMGLKQNSSASQAIGYRQCLEFLASPQKAEDWEQFVSAFKQASRRYAKRQFTWFRKEPLFRWLNLEDIPSERALELILQDFELP
jgi:tRNA dimethylallyltransferase